MTLFHRTCTDFSHQFVTLTEIDCMEQGGKRKKDVKGRKKMRQRYDVTGTCNQLGFKGPVSKAKLFII